MALTLLKNTGLATFGVLLQGLARFLYTVLVGRFFGAEILGETSTLIAFAVFISLFWPTGAGVAASRFVTPTHRDHAARDTPLAYVTRDFLWCLPAIAVGSFLGALVISADIWVAFSSALLALTYSGYAFTRGAALGRGKFQRIAIFDTVSSVVGIALLAAVLFAEAHWATLLPLAASYLVFTLACWPRLKKLPRSSNSPITRFIIYSSLAQLATGGTLQIAMVGAQIYDTPSEAGLFAAAFSLATPASMIALSVNQVLIPHFAQAAANGEPARRMPWKATVTLIAALAALFGILFIASETLLTLLFGAAFSAATPYMHGLLIGVFAYSLSLVAAASLVATGSERRYTWLAGVGFLTTLVAIVALGPAFGAGAAMGGYVAGSVVSALLVLLAVFRADRRRHGNRVP